MKRLLCILNSMNMGGAETFLMKIYRVLDRSRYQMDFCISMAEKCDYEDEILSMGGKIFRIPSKSKDSKAFKQQLYAVVKDNGYADVLRITSNAAGFWDLKIAKQAGALHTAARSSNASDGSIVQSAAHLLGRVLWTRYVDVKIAPSDKAASYTFGKRACRRGEVERINNGLDLSVYRFDEEGRQRVRSRLGISPSTVLVGHVGRFNTQKNHRFLVSAFAAFHREQPDSKLCLVGEGVLQAEIEAAVGQEGLTDSVVFAGLQKDIPAWLSAFDVLALPSLYEGMPNVIIEAQACGCPCILSDTVTREADLCGKTVYLPITDAAVWGRQIAQTAKQGRVTADMRAYDIHRSAQAFCRCCYGAKGDSD